MCFLFRFVRFLTLDEAKDAVREKHLKAIGNKQIHVELSADTRRKIQDHDTDEGTVITLTDYSRSVGWLVRVLVPSFVCSFVRSVFLFFCPSFFFS